jgi:hypothetical protein
MLARCRRDIVWPTLRALGRDHLIKHLCQATIVGGGDFVTPMRHGIERFHNQLPCLTVQPRYATNLGGGDHGEAPRIDVACGLHIEQPGPGTSVGTLISRSGRLAKPGGRATRTGAAARQRGLRLVGSCRFKNLRAQARRSPLAKRMVWCGAPAANPAADRPRYGRPMLAGGDHGGAGSSKIAATAPQAGSSDTMASVRTCARIAAAGARCAESDPCTFTAATDSDPALPGGYSHRACLSACRATALSSAFSRGRELPHRESYVTW